MQIWELLFSEQIFGSADEHGSIESMIKYIGAPPREFLDICAHSQAFFDSNGECCSTFIVTSADLWKEIGITGL